MLPAWRAPAGHTPHAATSISTQPGQLPSQTVDASPRAAEPDEGAPESPTCLPGSPVAGAGIGHVRHPHGRTRSWSICRPPASDSWNRATTSTMAAFSTAVKRSELSCRIGTGWARTADPAPARSWRDPWSLA